MDDLLITSTSTSMIEELTSGLKKRYGERTLKHGPIVNYLGMVLDFSHPGEARITMGGYIDDMLKNSGIVGTARTPCTDGLFDIRDTALPVPEAVRVWFHSLIASILYVAKRTKPECLVAVSAMAIKVHSCDSDDVDKAIRLVKYLSGGPKTRGLYYVREHQGSGYTFMWMRHMGCMQIGVLIRAIL